MILNRFASSAGLAIALGGAMTACSVTGSQTPDLSVALTYEALETPDGSCRPRQVARANVAATDLYALYGSVRFINTNGAAATRLPLQLVFQGQDEAGLSEVSADSLLNFDAPCDAVRIEHQVRYCLLNATRPDRSACPVLSVSGEGFAGFEPVEDRSQALAENPNG
jgi:hypothetical protein